MCPYLDTWVMSQKASAALKYMSGVGAEPSPTKRGTLVAREGLMGGAVVAHRGELEKRRHRLDVGLERDLATLDSGIESLGDVCHCRLLAGSAPVQMNRVARQLVYQAPGGA